MTYRLFVGVYPPEAALDDLAALLDGLHLGRSGIRRTPRERWHLTVAFLGDVEEERVSDVEVALDKVVAPPPELRLAGGGRFGRGRFTIVWTGVDGPVAPLAQAVRRQLKRARVPYDRKPFRPHLTLARPGGRLTPAELAADLAALRAYQGPLWTVDELRLVRSHLGPNPIHETLSSIPL
jgi:RNA 2',3'-cyclic 3'-phosphodiesterase